MSEVDNRPSHIILIGPPGAGKSTVGGLLARSMNVDFVDTDNLVEERTGKKIAEIFVEDGETSFRFIEEDVVIKVLDHTDGVIALGGGSILSEQVQKRLKSLLAARSGKIEVIFLDVSIACAAPRVGFNRERPLLTVNPRASWQALMNRRRPIYQQLASRTVDTNDCTPEEVVAKIMDGWRD